MHSFEDSAAIIIQKAIRRVFQRKEDWLNTVAKFSNEEEKENYRLLYSLYLCHKDDEYWGPYYEYACFCLAMDYPRSVHSFRSLIVMENHHRMEI